MAVVQAKCIDFFTLATSTTAIVPSVTMVVHMIVVEAASMMSSIFETMRVRTATTSLSTTVRVVNTSCMLVLLVVVTAAEVLKLRCSTVVLFVVLHVVFVMVVEVAREMDIRGCEVCATAHFASREFRSVISVSSWFTGPVELLSLFARVSMLLSRKIFTSLVVVSRTTSHKLLLIHQRRHLIRYCSRVSLRVIFGSYLTETVLRAERRRLTLMHKCKLRWLILRNECLL